MYQRRFHANIYIVETAIRRNLHTEILPFHIFVKCIIGYYNTDVFECVNTKGLTSEQSYVALQISILLRSLYPLQEIVYQYMDEKTNGCNGLQYFIEIAVYKAINNRFPHDYYIQINEHEIPITESNLYSDELL